MLTHGNISFILIVEQKSCMVVANDDTHTINQRIEIVLVDIFLSSTICVICGYDHMELDFWDFNVYVFCN